MQFTTMFLLADLNCGDTATVNPGEQLGARLKEKQKNRLFYLIRVGMVLSCLLNQISLNRLVGYTIAPSIWR